MMQHGPQMSISPRIKNLKFEAADEASLPEVSSFFVDNFWLASTTFGSVELSAGDKGQLVRSVADDLGSRYGIQSNEKRPQMMGGRRGFPSKSLFETRLILAREPSGAIVGCVGIEAALFNPDSGLFFRGDQADKLVRTELDRMEADDADRASAVYKERGIGGLAKGIIQQQFGDTLVQPDITMFRACSVLENLVVAPSYRQSGLGRALCDETERVTTDEWKLDMIMLQVEDVNTAAITLYRNNGYEEVFRREEVALRLQPSAPSPFDNLPGPFSFLAPENEELLKEISSPTVTMYKLLEGLY